MAERELAAELAWSRRAGPARALSREETHVELRHVHLPKLADADLVTWDVDEATVVETATPATDERTFDRGVSEGDEWDDVLAHDPDGRRRSVLTILESRGGSLGRADLAHEVAAREADGEPSTETVEEVLVTLHHVHLPKLEAAGLVEYDAAEGTASSTDHRGSQ